jgi:predicted metal-dependent hydrolase
VTDNLSFSYRIRRSQRASRARIVVKPGLVEIVAPFGISEQRLHQFVHDKQQWIDNALKKMIIVGSEENRFVPLEFSTGAYLSYQGKPYVITVKPSPLKRVKIEFNSGFVIFLPNSLPITEQTDSIKQALIRWYKQQTKSAVEKFVQNHATKNNLKPKSITIKTQKSRWGSCGIHNDISINWLLMLAPPEVLEYVVVHELCHIQVKNHSSQFWAVVAAHLPDYQIRRGWLKKHGRMLMLAF